MGVGMGGCKPGMGRVMRVTTGWGVLGKEVATVKMMVTERQLYGGFRSLGV